MQHKKQLRSVSGLLALSALLGGLAPAANAATYYVDAVNGNNSTAAFDPSTSNNPYQTIGAAMYRAKTYFSSFGVDTIIVEPGVYTEYVSITQNGLTLKARNDAFYGSANRSIIRPSGPNIWNVVGVNSSNVTVRGFEIDGSNAYVDTGHTASGNGVKPNITNYGDVTNGVTINGDHIDSGNNSVPAAQHVTITRCVVHDCGGGGISTQNDNYNASADLSTGPTGGPDYVTVDENEIYYNCLWSKYSTSGISYHGNTNRNTGDTNYHCYIRRNRIHDNLCKFTGTDFFGETTHTDGNGIIIDTCGNQNPKTLIENNLVYKNGARGIHVFASSNVTAINNTTYLNTQDPQIVSKGSGAEITAISAHNVTYSNDICYGVGGNTPAFSVGTTYAYRQAGGVLQNIFIRATTYWGAGSGSANIPAGVIDWATVFNGNPYLHAPSTGDFTTDVAPTLSGKTSAQSQYVIDRASTTAGDFATVDFNGAARPATGKDRGAYERSLPAPMMAKKSAPAS